MPRNGNGTYAPPAGQPVVPGTTVSSSVFNALVADVSTELTKSISKDGQTPMAASLPMGGNKIIGMAVGTVASDAVRLDQITVKVDTSDLAAATGAGLVGVSVLDNTPSIVTVLSGTLQAVLAGLVKRVAWLFSPLWTDLRQVAAPAGTPTLALGAAGTLNGPGYAYAVTYVSPDGETEAGGESATIIATNQQINLTAIPVSGDASVTARRIYRTKASPTDAVLKYLVATIADNTTTTYVDNIADGALGVAVPRTNTTGGILKKNGVRLASADGDTTIFGKNCHPSNTGYSNTAFGANALAANTNGFRCTAFGNYALNGNTTGYENTAFGVHALHYLTTGNANTAVGYSAGMNITTGSGNTFVGDFAGLSCPTSTSNNTLIGYSALQQNTQTLGGNTALGTQAGFSNITGYGNVFVGYRAGYRCTDNNALVIDNQDRTTEASEQSLALIFGKFGASAANQFVKVNGAIRSANSSALLAQTPSATQAGAQIDSAGLYAVSSGASTAAVNTHAFYNGNGLVGVIQTSGSATAFTSVSDQRVKENIVTSGAAMPKVNALQVRAFNWIKTGEHVPYGLIAQEVYAVDPLAAIMGDEVQPWMVDNSKLVPLLIKAVQELSADFAAYKAAHP